MPSSTSRWALALALAAAPAARAQEAKQCPDGRPPNGDLGIELRCSSSRCVWGYAFSNGRWAQTFTTEPIVHALRPPADAVLEAGDVLVAIDGKLSTTADAGRRLAQVGPGEQVRLRLRRTGEEREVTITAIPTCTRIQVFIESPDGRLRWEGLAAPLGALEDFDWEGFSRDWNMKIIPPIDGFRFDFDTLLFDTRDSGLFARVEPPYELGVELVCGLFCGWRRGESGEPVWRGQHPPEVERVIEGGPAGSAGIRKGDVLLLLDGHSFIGEEGGQALGRLRPGRAVTLQYLKGGETLTTTTITPRAPAR